MSFQGFGKSSGPGAPPTSSNPFASSFPRNTAPAQPLFAPPPFQPSARPTETSAKWANEYPTLNEVYNSQTNQRAAVTPFNAVHSAGSRTLSKNPQAQDPKRDRSLPSLFSDEGTLRNSTTFTGMPRLPSPAWANQSKFPTRFTNSMNQQDQSSVLSNSGNYDNGGNLINKQAHVQAPKRTRSPVQYDDLDGFTEDTVSVQTESKRLSTRLSDHSGTPDSQSHEPFALSGPMYPEAATSKLSVPKRSRSPSSLISDRKPQGDINVAQDDTEREMQAKAKRLARFKDELSQPEPSNLGIGNQKVPSRGYDQAMSDNRKSKESLDLPADNANANISTDYEGQESSTIISGLCPEMCPESERAERERKGDLDRFERLDGDRNQTSKYLAVKKYTRTAEREANLIRPLPILQKTMDYLLELLDQPYDDGFLGLYNFLWDRMRAIRMDLRMQHIFNLEAITMLEQMIRLHILAMHELCEYTKGEGFSEGFDAHLNIEQMNKTSVELFQLYDDHRKNGIDVPTEKEFRGYYALLKLDKHPGYKVEPAELSLDLAKMTPEVRQAPDILFARDVARSCRIGNFIAFFRLVRKASYLQACLMHAHFAKLRTQALASLHSGLQNNQGIPVAHVAEWLGMEDEEIEDLLDYHGFSIKEFGEPYMVKEGPFLNNNDSGTSKCSKLVHQKKSKTMFEDVLSPSLMEPVSLEAVKKISLEKVYEKSNAPDQSNLAQDPPVIEEEMDSEPVSMPTKEVPIKPIFKAAEINQQNVHDHQPAALNPVPGNISTPHVFRSMDDRVNDAVTDSFKFEFRSSFGKNKNSETKTMPQDIVPIVVDQEKLPVPEIDLTIDNIVPSPLHVEDSNYVESISTFEDLENNEGGRSYQDEEIAQAKLILMFRKWRRYSSKKRELRNKKEIAADTALSSLSLGPSIRHYQEQRSTPGEFNVHLVMKERHDKHERSWSKLNVSDVVAHKLSERNSSSKFLCWKVVLCSQIYGLDGSCLSGLAAGSWLHSKIIPAGDYNDDNLLTSSTALSIWKKWIEGFSSDELICCLSIIKDTRCDNVEENVSGANAVMFIVYECIPLELQKQRLQNLVMSLPSGSSIPLLILSSSCKNHSTSSSIANKLGLDEVDKSRISCFSVVFLLENQSTVFHDSFFSDALLREGLEWLASNSPSQPVLQSVTTQELVFTHLNPLLDTLDGRSAYEVSPTHCISAFNDALNQSIDEVVAAADANPSCWPCPEMALLEQSSDVHRAVNCYLAHSLSTTTALSLSHHLRPLSLPPSLSKPLFRIFHITPSTFLKNPSLNSSKMDNPEVAIQSVADDFNKQSLGEAKLKLEDLNWDHSFVRELPGDPRTDIIPREVLHACYTKVLPSVEVENPQLVAWSESVAELLDLDPGEFERPDIAHKFSGASPLAGGMPYAQCYGGHQFGMWAGQLGDGRAITLGEVLNSKSERWELQLKGAGKTPYSRFADGLAVLRSSIREFLCSEAMKSLGIPTTRALCLVTTGKNVSRDMFYDGNPKDEPGAVVCRVAQSFLRFGSFQLHASRGKEDLDIVRTLADYTIRHHFPHIENMSKSESLSFSTGEEDNAVVDLTSNKYAAWTVEVAERTASLVASWQGVGFTHGVLNTDNMSVLGLTIDYGPFGFLDAFDPSYTPNTTDLPGRRYCFANQPDIGLWNIAQFASTISAAKLINDKEANYAMERYGTKFMDEYQAIMTKKLGLPKYNKQLISKLLNNMAVDKVDYTNFFRILSNIKADVNIPEEDLLVPLKAVLLDIGKERKEAWTSWVQTYIQELVESGISDEERKTSMNSINPKYVLRNYLCQSAIDVAESGDFGEVQRLLKVMEKPFDEQPGMEKYARLPPAWAYRPGVCMLSCSS